MLKCAQEFRVGLEEHDFKVIRARALCDQRMYFLESTKNCCFAVVDMCPQERVGVETTREVSIRFRWGGWWQHTKTILLQTCWSIIIIPIVLCQVQNPVVRIPIENSLGGWIKQQMLFCLIYVGNCCRATLWNFVLLANCTSQSNENNKNEESELMCTGESHENHHNEE